jgi:hypothetical protein
MMFAMPASRLASSRAIACALLGWAAAGTAGCSGAPGIPGESELTGAIAAPIINGSTASAYPESALLTMTQSGSQYEGFCSGALVAPQVVLTAGHCVKGVMSSMQTLVPDTWQVTLPYNGGQQFTATSSAVYDWQTNDGTVDPTWHDIGLVFLTSAANMTSAQCPVLATAPVDSTTQVVNIGRVTAGNPSMTDLFVGAPVSVATSPQYPYDYQSTDIIEEGDSGGPDEVPGSSPHLIVAVNSGAGAGGGISEQVLARVDLLNSSANDWITQQIAMHGGLGVCVSTTSSGGSSSSGSTSGGSSSGGASSSSGGVSSSGGASGSGGSSGMPGGTGGTSSGSSATSGEWGTAPPQNAGCACRASGSATDAGGAPLAGLVAGLAVAAGALTRRRTRGVS